MYWPRSYRRIPYHLMRGYRGLDDGAWDGDGCGPGGNCGGGGPWGGFGFGGLGSFIIGGLTGAFLANAFGSKNAQAAQPVIAQPVVQPIPIAQPMPYGYSPYGSAPQAIQVQNQQGQKQIISSSAVDEDEELYPDFDEWKGKQPIKETHHVYTIPAQSTYVQPTTYQMPMTAMYPAGMTPYPMAQQAVANYPMVQSGVTSYQLPTVGRPVTTAMPYYMFPVQQ